jgi:hypothetical protein
MNQEEQFKALEEKTRWLRKHLRITFILSVLGFLMILGHFILHATGKLPH